MKEDLDVIICINDGKGEISIKICEKSRRVWKNKF